MCNGAAIEAAGHAHHHSVVSRRSFFKTGGVAVAAGAALAAASPVLPALASNGVNRRVIDLTHRLVETFPSFFGPPAASSEVLFDFDTAGFYAKQWTIEEHIGTHIDTPGHFSPTGTLVDALPAADLVAPIIVIDIKDKAASDSNATVSMSDILVWEASYGRIPRRSIVAMNSGWASKVDDGAVFRGGTGFPDLAFPGFSAEAAGWLLAKRGVVGIASDTMSLDPGNSGDFAVHFSYLPAGGYGIESIANLDALPARGATAFVGAIPWEDGSGSPVRVLAVV